MPEGYTRLASFMGTHPESAILRRFGFLNAMNLLHLQAELTCLENDLRSAAKADSESGHEARILYDKDWQSLYNSLTAEDGNPTQCNLMMKVREKLNEYSMFLVFWYRGTVCRIVLACCCYSPSA